MMSEWLADEELRDRRLPETWTTRDGRVVRIAEMEDSHLLSTIALLRRRNRAGIRARAWRTAMRAGSYAETAPDGAADAAMECVSARLRGDCDDEILAEELPEFAALVEEARRRKLEIRL